MQNERVFSHAAATTLGATTTQANRRAATASSRGVLLQLHRFSKDANSSDLVNFPFALRIYVLALLGVSAMCWGTILDNEWLAGFGFLASALGVALYDLSLADE